VFALFARVHLVVDEVGPQRVRRVLRDKHDEQLSELVLSKDEGSDSCRRQYIQGPRYFAERLARTHVHIALVKHSLNIFKF
jgi:hypothetical protein